MRRPGWWPAAAHAFLATLSYTGPRPEEAVAMRVLDARLPGEGEEDQWASC
ncbi:hypothetical protein OHS70_24400 [Streptomyces sp. NBC_00390]|uniref:hypothetical protein n=1 Tax=Streptomyces sp. NBC_00390 TaxID=2975736 RepID=UPI002E1AF250